MPDPKEYFDNRISLGNLIQIVLIVGGLSVNWLTMDNRSKSNAQAIEDLTTSITTSQNRFDRRLNDMDNRVRDVEQSLVRADERYTSLLQVLGRIDARLERIENTK